jgi:hypothetical protein
MIIEQGATFTLKYNLRADNMFINGTMIMEVNPWYQVVDPLNINIGLTGSLIARASPTKFEAPGNIYNYGQFVVSSTVPVFSLYCL